MRQVIFVLLFCSFSCDNKTNENSHTTSEIKSDKVETENFDEFLTKFNTDVEFKLTRIRFPIEQAIKDPIEGNEAYMTYDSSSNWLKALSLEYRDEFHDGMELEFKQDTVRTESEIIIQQRGGYINSHITRDMDFRFALHDGVWYLVAMRDFSYM